MTVRATMICDSIGEHAPRLSTILMYYPHVIHNELLTHRVFSRNSALSRAIPIWKMIQSVLDDPYIPPKWYKNEPGMQGKVELEGAALADAKWAYERAMNQALHHAEWLDKTGVHKQIVNRILNPYMHILVLVTSTQWSNFLHVRDHKDAEPNMELLAKVVRVQLSLSTPRLLKPGEWHAPFTDYKDWSGIAEQDTTNMIKLSVARCASTSYKTVEGFDMTLDHAVTLHDRLVAGDPVHASPTEHQAKVDELRPERGITNGDTTHHLFKRPRLSGNFAPGWIQYRKTIPGECR